MHNDLDKVNKLEAYDICIVGSGPAGLSIASKLINKGVKFIILESGGVNPNPKYRELNEGYSKGPRKLDMVNSRLRAIGGAGKIWAGVCRPIDPEEFENKNKNFLGGWPIKYSDIEEYYKEAANMLGINFEEFFNYEWKKQARLAVKFEKFAEDKSLLRGVKYQRASAEKRDLGNTFQKLLFEDENCTFLTNATLTDIIQADNKKIDHVIVRSFQGKKMKVFAKNFVICAGAIENPRILLDSSLNEKIKGNKFIGACFMSHPAFRGVGRIFKKDAIRNCEENNLNLENDFGFEMISDERIKSSNLRHNIHFSPTKNLEVTSKDSNYYDIIRANIELLARYSNKAICKIIGGEVNPRTWNIDIAIEQEPRLNNKVALSNKTDRHGKRMVEIFWDSVSKREKQTVIEAVKAVGRESMLTQTGLCRVSESLTNGEIFDQDDSINHHIGTTRMASSKKQGVVDSNLKIFGVENLFLSGSSVFPTSSIVNPTYTIIALSLRLGNHLLKQLELSS